MAFPLSNPHLQLPAPIVSLAKAPQMACFAVSGFQSAGQPRSQMRSSFIVWSSQMPWQQTVCVAPGFKSAATLRPPTGRSWPAVAIPARMVRSRSRQAARWLPCSSSSSTRPIPPRPPRRL